MRNMMIAAITLLFGGGCGYFQYWMDTRLAQKRWLLLFQPGLLAALTACYAAWTLSLERLKGSPARLAWVPFAALLACTLAGWAVGAFRRKKRNGRDQE